MNTNTKEQIKNDLYQFVQKVGSQNMASKQLTKVSIATISNVLAGKWDSIADSMWLSIQNQVKPTGWIHVDTTVSRTLEAMYTDWKEYQEVRAIVAAAGSGKTHTAKRFCDMNTNAFHIECDNHMTSGDLLREVLSKLGVTPSGRSLSGMVKAIVEHLLKLENPILFFDEFDKLKNEVFLFFVTFYNKLEGKTAMVLQGAPYLSKRIDDGVQRQIKGYEEILSRVNSKVIALPKNKLEELKLIASLNGVFDELETTRIANVSDGSIRRIRTDVRVFLTKLKKKGAA
ncbi:ATP-binding protein [Sphingobacterium sp. LRF_L2]|uniref:ATP-binding protein n=1 Tax=Sphingobacterium sp. LRF_L2 TaxID=3369421 RepID=UPI003F646F9F